MVLYHSKNVFIVALVGFMDESGMISGHITEAADDLTMTCGKLL